MRIAIPVTTGRLSLHFGHAEAFALVDVDEDKGHIGKTRFVGAPDHQPGLLPGWLKQEGADMIIAGGMGSRARNIFTQYGIEVVIGAQNRTPEEIVGDYLDNRLQLGENFCDH